MAKQSKLKNELNSVRKPRFHYGREKEELRLPYPVPLINCATQIQYPLDEKKDSVIYFNCYINYDEGCCEVREECSMHALYYHGCFGKGSLSSNAPIYEIVDKIKHDFTLDGAFRNRPDIGTIVDDLYRKTPPSSRSPSPVISNVVTPTIEKVEYERNKEKKETLKLSLEETFFLAYCLGCLTVADPITQSKLNLTQIWNKFCSIYCPSGDKADFVGLYAAYHYFRSKGWVVKSGTKFGADFNLYKDGPNHYHALFSVVVFTLRTNQTIGDKYPNRDWRFLSGLNRLSESVRKSAVQCIVIVPEQLNDVQLSDPRVIHKLEIRTIFMKRFNASQETPEPSISEI